MTKPQPTKEFLKGIAIIILALMFLYFLYITHPNRRIDDLENKLDQLIEIEKNK